MRVAIGRRQSPSDHRVTRRRRIGAGAQGPRLDDYPIQRAWPRSEPAGGRVRSRNQSRFDGSSTEVKSAAGSHSRPSFYHAEVFCLVGEQLGRSWDENMRYQVSVCSLGQDGGRAQYLQTFEESSCNRQGPRRGRYLRRLGAVDEGAGLADAQVAAAVPEVAEASRTETISVRRASRFYSAFCSARNRTNPVPSKKAIVRSPIRAAGLLDR